MEERSRRIIASSAIAVAMMLASSGDRALAQGPVDATRVGDSVSTVTSAELATLERRFTRLSPRRREAVLSSMRDAVFAIDDPYVRAVRALAEEAERSFEPRVDAPRVRRVSGRSETAVDDALPLAARLPFPTASSYRFGLGTVEPIEITGPDGRRLSRSKQAAERHARELDAMLEGRLPGLDRALASLLRELDDERAMDLEAAFLESWTNGAETFYEALDRTAGRMEGVFHYDAMLEEWSRYCVPKDHPDRAVFRRGLDEQIRGFQEAFLSYRSYRSVREMLALALLLGPDDRLPEPLGRYESNGGDGTHSTRECVEVVLSVHGRDPRAVVAAFLANAERLADAPWRARHEAWRGVDRMFEDARDRAAATGLDTFELARRVREQRLLLDAHVARTALEAFVGAMR